MNMRDNTVKEAPNYFNTCMVLLGVNIMWVFVLLWALFGFFPVLVVAILMNHGITRLAVWRRWKDMPASAYLN